MKLIKKKIKSRFKKYFYDSNGFESTVKTLVSMHRANANSVKFHGEILSDRFLNFKKSDTLFVLGSGPSINELEKSEWDEMSRCDSIGFNYFFVHPFVPSMYMHQHAKPLDLLLKKFSERMENIPIIIRGSEQAKKGGISNDEEREFLRKLKIFYLNEFAISSKCEIDPLDLFDFMNTLGFLNHGVVANFVPKWRSTIGLILSLGIQMGYRKIILCGADMNDATHFWDADNYKVIKAKYGLPDPAGIRNFTDEEISANTLPVYIYKLRDWVKKMYDVDIFISSRNSVLYPGLDLYKFNS